MKSITSLNLNDSSVWLFLLAVVVAVIFMVTTKKWALGLLTGYTLVILGETVLLRVPSSGQHFQPQLFWSYRVWNVEKGQIIANILAFVPLGFLAGCLWKWKGIIAGIVLSMAIELLQLLSQRGLCEFDDILHNTLGTLIGVSRYMLVETAVKKKGNNNGLQK